MNKDNLYSALYLLMSRLEEFNKSKRKLCVIMHLQKKQEQNA